MYSGPGTKSRAACVLRGDIDISKRRGGPFIFCFPRERQLPNGVLGSDSKKRDWRRQRREGRKDEEGALMTPTGKLLYERASVLQRS